MDFDARSERGQALPLLLIVIAVTIVGLMVVVRTGRAADDAARARTAADAAALAGAAEGRSAAQRVALANGGVVVSYTAFGEEVEVVVRVGVATARARAERFTEWVPSGRVGGGDE